eukprot:TRINITY_DN16791_c0_g1_i1.p1 TRINITY_DN16791_c0_g1~~TRINITY_DN16791_c0_g1_i1.p1  ORF type:complete len:191 (+),score=41.69 TRINITY_DN16791_c0_g1_i1:603-1175(+)
MLHSSLTETHLNAVRLIGIFFICLNRASVFQLHMGYHLEAGKIKLYDLLDEGQSSAAVISEAMFVPYRTLLHVSMQYMAPLLVLTFGAVMVHLCGQQPVFVCELCRFFGADSSGYLASYSLQETEVGSWSSVRNTPKFWHPLFQFCVFWYLLCWFVCSTLSLMFWAGKSLQAKSEMEEAKTTTSAKHKRR